MNSATEAFKVAAPSMRSAPLPPISARSTAFTMAKNKSGVATPLMSCTTSLPSSPRGPALLPSTGPSTSPSSRATMIWA